MILLRLPNLRFGPHSHSFQLFKKVNLALVVASTNIAPPHLRGKLSGLYNTSESLGRFTGPAGFAKTFAWSISPAAFGWVDHYFVFLLSAMAVSMVAVLVWRTLEVETLTTTASERTRKQGGE